VKRIFQTLLPALNSQFHVYVPTIPSIAMPWRSSGDWDAIQSKQNIKHTHITCSAKAEVKIVTVGMLHN
jgi:hypothetical protein